MPPKGKAPAAAAPAAESDDEVEEEEQGAPATGLGKLFDLNLSGAPRATRALAAPRAVRVGRRG